jgi:hypothetical protein
MPWVEMSAMSVESSLILLSFFKVKLSFKKTGISDDGPWLSCYLKELISPNDDFLPSTCYPYIDFFPTEM